MAYIGERTHLKIFKMARAYKESVEDARSFAQESVLFNSNC